MADITVRNIRFEFEERIDFDVDDQTLSEMLGPLALSMTMPYLEPYLIRTMKVAIPRIDDPVLAEDAKRFSQQEGHHFRNHANFNRCIRDQFDEATAQGLRDIEAALEADYQRFSKQRPLRWNLAYAEGFEAMTCAGALALAESGAFSSGRLPGGEIWAWHMAEEIEHRTVAFQVFEHLVGSYLYRVVFGLRAQVHYLGYIRRFARCMAAGLGRQPKARASAQNKDAVRRWLRSFSPAYDPAKIELPSAVEELLAHYSRVAQENAA